MVSDRLHPPFQFHGGKFSHLGWMLPKLPLRDRYVEPFAGSAAVLLNRPRVETETLNDLNTDIITFFRALREEPAELVRRIMATPYSREVYHNSLEILDSNDGDDITRAWAFYVAYRQNVGGIKPTPGTWSYGVNSGNPTPDTFYSVERLFEIAERLRGVQIENLDGLDVMTRYDAPDALMYCDPPYPLGSRSGSGYEIEMDDEQHGRFLEIATSAEADIAISTYPNEMYETVLMEDSEDWWKYTQEAAVRIANEQFDEGTTKTEVLYMNYDPRAVDNPTLERRDALSEDW